MKKPMLEFDDMVAGVGDIFALMVFDGRIKSAEKIINPKCSVKGTRHGRTKSILFTYGLPCSKTRAFAKLCVKAHEPFPVKKLRLKYIE